MSKENKARAHQGRAKAAVQRSRDNHGGCGERLQVPCGARVARDRRPAAQCPAAADDSQGDQPCCCARQSRQDHMRPVNTPQASSASIACARCKNLAAAVLD